MAAPVVSPVRGCGPDARARGPSAGKLMSLSHSLAAVSVLSGPYGVEIPVASAVLTAVAPERTQLSITVRWKPSARSGRGTQSIAIWLTFCAAGSWSEKTGLA
jgi:hypothetical protein